MSDPAALHEHFVAAVLPKIERQAGVSFARYRRNPEKVEELTAEAVALGWQQYVRLVERDKNPDAFLTVFAQRVCQAARNGRRVTGTWPAKDALSPVAHTTHGFTTESLPQYSTGADDNPIIDALRDNTHTGPPDQAAFRLDYPRWLENLPPRDREMAEAMVQGDGNTELAERFHVTPARISQKRRELFERWREYQGETLSGMTR